MRGVVILVVMWMGWAGAGAAGSETAVWDQVHTRALSGDRILFKGREMVIANLTCPGVDTEKGKRAKGLMNTFLRRAGHFICEVELLDTGILRGRCTVAERKGLKGRVIASGMIQSGLCHAGDRTGGSGA